MRKLSILILASIAFVFCLTAATHRPQPTKTGHLQPVKQDSQGWVEDDSVTAITPNGLNATDIFDQDR